MGTRKKKEVLFTRCPDCHAPINRTDSSCPRCGTSIEYRGRITKISVSGSVAKEVQEVSLALLEKTKPSKISPNPWASGSFYLIVFIVVITAFAVVGKVLPSFVLPIVLIGAILALSVIGALQMRQDEKLSEENFLKLMALSFKYLPWLRRRKEQEN